MSRNSNVGSRTIESAVPMLLGRAQQRKVLSFSSVASHESRVSHFWPFAREHGVRRLEAVTRELVLSYGESVRLEVEKNQLKPSTAQNRISSVNVVMGLADSGWVAVRPVADCGIPKRSNLRLRVPPDQGAVDLAIRYLDDACLERVACVCSLAHALGLRCKEASLLNCSIALVQALSGGVVEIRDGTKGNKLRKLSNIDAKQIEVLQRGAQVQGRGRNLIPPEMSWIAWLNGPLREGRSFLKAAGVKGYHELRAAYACARYLALTGFPAPCIAGKRVADVQADLEARKVITKELGHERIDVVASYVGGRK